LSRLVLFDLDGTLLDTAKDFTQVLNQQLHQHEMEAVSFQRVRETVSDGARALIKMGFGIDDSHSNFDHYLQELLDLYAEKIVMTEAVLFKGITELLQNIEAEQLQWGIVTNKPSRFTLPLLEKFTAMSNSSVVLCADQVKNGKPDPEGLLMACQMLACKTEHCIYVGDHKRDIDAGKNANIKTIAVSWGYYPEHTRLEDWQADLIVNSPQEITNYLFG
tara:strand:- start:178704 stop:179360 length:657 start_codon:yes stop_codon:yes gene_type:complete